VITDYDGFDTASNLNRPDVFRLNIAVGRSTFEEVIGYPPAAHTEHSADFDYAALDRVLPHPVYAAQSWVSILNPGAASSAQARDLLSHAHARASRRRWRGP
jgi:soluble lytic murein transglycosylase-like protein